MRHVLPDGGVAGRRGLGGAGVGRGGRSRGQAGTTGPLAHRRTARGDHSRGPACAMGPLAHHQPHEGTTREGQRARWGHSRKSLRTKGPLAPTDRAKGPLAHGQTARKGRSLRQPNARGPLAQISAGTLARVPPSEGTTSAWSGHARGPFAPEAAHERTTRTTPTRRRDHLRHARRAKGPLAPDQATREDRSRQPKQAKDPSRHIPAQTTTPPRPLPRTRPAVLRTAGLTQEAEPRAPPPGTPPSRGPDRPPAPECGPCRKWTARTARLPPRPVPRPGRR